MQRYLATLLHLRNTGFPELADQIRIHMKHIAALVLPSENLATQIYALMSEVDAQQLNNVLDKVWECRNNSLARNINPFSFDVIASKIDHINKVYWTSPSEAENRLRSLLLECEDLCGFAFPCTLTVLSEIVLNLLRQERHTEGEATSTDMRDRARRAKSSKYEVIALELLAETQHALGNSSLACENLSARWTWWSEGVTGRIRGVDRLRLDIWLRGAERAGEADLLRVQLDELMSDSAG